MDTPVASPAEVTVRGPESVVNSIDKVMANVTLDEQRTESALTTAQLEFLDKEGNPVESDYLTMDVSLSLIHISTRTPTLLRWSAPSNTLPSCN